MTFIIPNAKPKTHKPTNLKTSSLRKSKIQPKQVMNKTKVNLLMMVPRRTRKNIAMYCPGTEATMKAIYTYAVGNRLPARISCAAALTKVE